MTNTDRETKHVFMVKAVRPVVGLIDDDGVPVGTFIVTLAAWDGRVEPVDKSEFQVALVIDGHLALELSDALNEKVTLAIDITNQMRSEAN